LVDARRGLCQKIAILRTSCRLERAGDAGIAVAEGDRAGSHGRARSDWWLVGIDPLPCGCLRLGPGETRAA
jgi:hypothetical protein